MYKVKSVFGITRACAFACLHVQVSGYAWSSVARRLHALRLLLEEIAIVCIDY